MKSLGVEVSLAGSSFKYSSNRVGPGTKPIGTQKSTVVYHDCAPLMTIACFMFDWMSSIHWWILQVMP